MLIPNGFLVVVFLRIKGRTFCIEIPCNLSSFVSSSDSFFVIFFVAVDTMVLTVTSRSRMWLYISLFFSLLIIIFDISRIECVLFFLVCVIVLLGLAFKEFDV